MPGKTAEPDAVCRAVPAALVLLQGCGCSPGAAFCCGILGPTHRQLQFAPHGMVFCPCVLGCLLFAAMLGAGHMLAVAVAAAAAAAALRSAKAAAAAALTSANAAAATAVSAAIFNRVLLMPMLA